MKNVRERIDKVLARSGYGSRKNVKKIIKSGQVSVNKSIISDPGYYVDPLLDDIIVEGRKLAYRENIYIMMNKPEGVISSTRDNNSLTVIDLLQGEYSHRKLFPVGRLDKDAQGLILLTDDGKMAHKILSPKNRIPKTYYVKVMGSLNQNDVKAFESGIDLGDFTTLPAKLHILESGDISQAHVTIFEGKFHQIKRMFKATNKSVIFLKRISLGPLNLDERLAPGMWRELTDEELGLLV